MLRWCAYCQQFQGETPPYHDLSLTHGLCPSCAVWGADVDVDDVARIQRLKGIQDSLAEAALRGNYRAADDAISAAADANVRAVDVLMGLVAPLLYEVGEQWARAAVSVEQEHRFTAFCEELFERVAARSETISVTTASLGPVVLMRAPGNQHRLAVRILTLWLASHGVRAWVAGPVEGLDALVELVRRVNARLVLLSVALAEQRPAIVAVARAISSIPENLRPKIIVGGNAVKMGLIEPVEGTELMSDISQLMSRAAG